MPASFIFNILLTEKRRFRYLLLHFLDGKTRSISSKSFWWILMKQEKKKKNYLHKVSSHLKVWIIKVNCRRSVEHTVPNSATVSCLWKIAKNIRAVPIVLWKSSLFMLSLITQEGKISFKILKYNLIKNFQKNL